MNWKDRRAQAARERSIVRVESVELSALRAERRARLSDFLDGRSPCACNVDVSFDVCWMCEEIEAELSAISTAA